MKDLKWGVRIGLTMGGMCTLLALVIYAAGGSGRFDKLHITVLSLIAVYFLGGLLAGVVLGVFRSTLRERYSSFVVSVIPAMPVSAGMTVLATGKTSDWGMQEWSTTAFMSLFMAAVGISVFWKDTTGLDSE